MARDLEIKDDPVVARKVRTWRGQLESPPGVDPSDYWVRGHRQVVAVHQSGAVTVEENTRAPDVTRRLAQIAKQSFSAPNCPTVTGAQLMALISAAFDAFDQEDEDAAIAAADAAKG